MGQTVSGDLNVIYLHSHISVAEHARLDVFCFKNNDISFLKIFNILLFVGSCLYKTAAPIRCEKC